METEQLVNCKYSEVQSLFSQAIITQAQYEAYCFAWENSPMRLVNTPYYWRNLPKDARAEFWKIFHACPKNIKTSLHVAICS